MSEAKQMNGAQTETEHEEAPEAAPCVCDCGVSDWRECTCPSEDEGPEYDKYARQEFLR